MTTTKKEKEITKEHPLEEVMGIEPGTTVAAITERSTELVISDEYDDKDSEIEEQFQEVYDAAFQAFEDQADSSETIDPKFRARNSEVGVQFLNTALAAAKEKSNMKQHKDKLTIDKVKNTGPQTLHQNLIVADRNQLLRDIFQDNPDALVEPNKKTHTMEDGEAIQSEDYIDQPVEVEEEQRGTE